MSHDALPARQAGVPSSRELPVATTAYRAMHALILNTEWAPGFRATEAEAADLFSTSRTPIRETFMLLEHNGTVEGVPRKGLRVLPVSPDDMREIYQVVTALEATAAELVASAKPSPAELGLLDEATSAMSAALEADDLKAWAEADERFHSELLVLCGNATLAALVTNRWGRMHADQPGVRHRRAARRRHRGRGDAGLPSGTGSHGARARRCKPAVQQA